VLVTGFVPPHTQLGRASALIHISNNGTALRASTTRGPNHQHWAQGRPQSPAGSRIPPTNRS